MRQALTAIRSRRQVSKLAHDVTLGRTPEERERIRSYAEARLEQPAWTDQVKITVAYAAIAAVGSLLGAGSIFSSLPGGLGVLIASVLWTRARRRALRQAVSVNSDVRVDGAG